jgi:hypothetical protein
VLRYGQNAYHHWVSGVVTGIFSLGIGLIVGLMPHHQHYFSVDLKSGKVLGIQADKSDYKEIAGMLQNSTGLPIQTTAKDAHYLNGFNVQVVADESKSKLRKTSAEIGKSLVWLNFRKLFLRRQTASGFSLVSMI